MRISLSLSLALYKRGRGYGRSRRRRGACLHKQAAKHVGLAVQQNTYGSERGADMKSCVAVMYSAHTFHEKAFKVTPRALKT